MIMFMFEDMADDIFLQAECDKDKARDLWFQTRDILKQKMASFSATMGMSKRRFDLFEKQRRSLVKDLIKAKKENPEISL